MVDREAQEDKPELTGSEVLAMSLQQQGVDSMFGVVGFPVYGVAGAAQNNGMRYLGFRNEQAASYAAGVVGYMTGRPGCCLAVSGPGMVHGIAGLANAWANCWPMVLIGGANDSFQNGRGAFQEAPQVEAARPFVKYAARPDSIERVPFYVEQAVRTSIYGRPGAVYLDLPNDILSGKVDRDAVEWAERCPEPPRSLADPSSVARAIEVLRSAERPLVVVGKGAAYAGAEQQVQQFLERTGLPFIPSPMGKGVMPDSSPQSVASARSFALQNADAVLLIGARLNWILHFGKAPRWAEELKVIQIDIAAEEMGTNVPAEVALCGHADEVVAQLNAALESAPYRVTESEAGARWLQDLEQSAEPNRRAVAAMEQDDSEPMGYYRVLKEVREVAPQDSVFVCEGANTMDISRTVLPNELPKHRLDAGTFGTMGVGAGFAIAAAWTRPDKKIVAVQGDSAFGFSAMEVEVACRYRLPITWVVVNNNGIASGLSEIDFPPEKIPPWVYTPNARYETIIEAFGGRGWYVDSVADLRPALEEAMTSDVPAVVNVMIDPKAKRKPQKFEWLTR